jgi:hypothetical protein
MEQVKFTLGSDPELFLRDSKSKQLRSAVPIIPEGKGDGRKLDSTGQNCVIHDNVLIEFNTLPKTDSDGFVTNIASVLGNIQKIVAKSGLELHLQASADFPEDQLCAESRIFGCDPDFGVYPTPGMNYIDDTAAEQPFRSAGGHLHIGKHKGNPELNEMLDLEDGSGKVRVVKAMDIFIGIISVFLEKDSTAAARRDLYGKAGAHRPKPYGVEYRACSPWWLATPEHTKLVYALTNAALAVCLDEEDLEDLSDDIGGEDEIQSIINDSRENDAFAVFERNLMPILGDETNALILSLHEREAEDFRSSWKI